MASPQIENGFTRIANELLDALCSIELSGHEWKVVHAIIRKTYGYNKKEDWVTNTQIMTLTGQTQQKVSLAKRSLVGRNIVTENGNKISINKDYEKWKCQIKLPKTVTELPKTVTKVTENGEHNKQKTVSKDTTAPSAENKLKANNQDMGFNKYADDFEEELQIDPDHAPKPKAKKKVADEIQQVFDLFDNPAKAIWRLREVEREAAKALFEIYGIETLKKRIARIEVEKKLNEGDNFFPLINTPSHLLDKMESVERYLKI